MVAAGPENPPRNQVVPVVRPPSGAISARPCHGLSGAPYTCSGGPSELGGWVHGCWGQHHRRAHPSNAFCPPHATQVRGRTSGTTPPVHLGKLSKRNALRATQRCWLLPRTVRLPREHTVPHTTTTTTHPVATLPPRCWPSMHGRARGPPQSRAPLRNPAAGHPPNAAERAAPASVPN
jgi:hypothetical protein